MYHQIFLMLRDEILSGQRPFGSLVPTEQEVGAQFSVSRITARRALDELAQAGLVERRRRTGTRVIHRSTGRTIEADLNQAVEVLITPGQNTSLQILEEVVETADPAIAARLRLESGAEVVRVVGVREFEGAPLGEITSWLPVRYRSALNHRGIIEKSIMTLLREAGVKISGAHQSIEARVADPHLAERLAIEARAPVLRIERLVEDDAGQPVQLTVAHYRADRYRISHDLHSSYKMAPDLR
ncbi:GntR family transcriptional regulator [Pedomonas mirosovicensis]|uniref:GntR family transcriptional regulator n=1 Tax=Pedomonas mirosovicensis TaxID=2908641 RepID=UPI002169B4AE|nr:GntR family transcriptional regulator [Pedomonas mirosovicensis]MCH8686777.1 GntR family transcriptional regulator [Pedomonas mirosovicensis]